MSIDYATSQDAMSFFRSIPTDLFDKYSGIVEAPCGWFGVLTLDNETIDDLERDYDAAPDSVRELVNREGVARFFVTIDSNGLVWAEYYSREEFDSVDGAYARAEAEYARWNNDDDEEEGL